jgi:hypothetical protein
MWRCGDRELTDVSEERIASIFRGVKFASGGTSVSRGLQTDVSTLKMEVISFSEKSVNAISTQRHIPEDDILHSHRCGNLKSYK